MRRRSRLTPEEQQECRRLKAAWQSWQAAHPGHNQLWLAEQLGMNQSAVSHYLNGRNAVNAGLLVKVKKALGVEPAEVSPRIAAELAPITARSSATMTVVSGAEHELLEYIRVHGGTDTARASIARRLLIAAKAFLEPPVADEKVERAGFNAAKRRQTVKK